MASRCRKYPTPSHKCGACNTIKAQDGWEFYGCRLLKNKHCSEIKDEQCPRFNNEKYWESLAPTRSEDKYCSNCGCGMDKVKE